LPKDSKEQVYESMKRIAQKICKTKTCKLGLDDDGGKCENSIDDANDEVLL
jgi:hypothetical protein